MPSLGGVVKSRGQTKILLLLVPKWKTCMQNLKLVLASLLPFLVLVSRIWVGDRPTERSRGSGVHRGQAATVTF